MVTKKSRVLMDAKQISHSLSRIAHEILESVKPDDEIAVIGIRSRGDHLAKRLAAHLREFDGRPVEVGFMDITLYRDDLLTNPEQPEIKGTEIIFSLQNKLVVLVDDVLFTGRTIRAALNQIRDYGRTKAVRLAVLVDRGGRELPIRADYVGKNIPTSSKDEV
ncbi:MAG: bifunctional pyr operon transcriptional regulator/uracil phosphoribosyltransferase PyrR, partial [bacterium]